MFSQPLHSALFCHDTNSVFVQNLRTKGIVAQCSYTPTYWGNIILYLALKVAGLIPDGVFEISH